MQDTRWYSVATQIEFVVSGVSAEGYEWDEWTTTVSTGSF